MLLLHSRFFIRTSLWARPIISRSMLPRWPCKTKHTPETTAPPGIRWSTQFGRPWPASTSPWSTAFVVVLIWILVFKLGGLKKVPQILGHNKVDNKRKAVFFSESDWLVTSTKSQQALTRLILVKLVVVMDVPADSKFGIPRSQRSRVCIWFCTAF